MAFKERGTSETDDLDKFWDMTSREKGNARSGLAKWASWLPHRGSRCPGKPGMLLLSPQRAHRSQRKPREASEAAGQLGEVLKSPFL